PGLEQRDAAATERQLAQQGAFHARTEAPFRELAGSVKATLSDSVASSAREARAAMQPVLESTLAAIASHAESTRESVTGAVQRHLDGRSEERRVGNEGRAGGRA